ncbi:MAG: hypothetical protein CMQ20_08040 [Gammaproteobacteria bacterium]|nr:hypothetical protein [Gammaproteobacteria bacterium]
MLFLLQDDAAVVCGVGGDQVDQRRTGAHSVKLLVDLRPCLDGDLDIGFRYCGDITCQECQGCQDPERGHQYETTL